ncbi:AAA family ATPase [Sulfurospirillum oryzae]|uniref:AAA family ATPase n=1 Tax=Sulfurospirillum oryzae TaxID=2976535 RepID=UPI0021E88365|nr:AAA family ATPase [Sulfurospirillum oryzae]
MKIKTLKLTNFRNYKYFDIDFDKKLNVIVAENGIGKTTILDAIAIGFGAMVTRMPKVSGKSFEEKDLRLENADSTKKAPYMRIQIDTYQNIVWDRTQSRDNAKGTKKNIPPAKELGLLYAYVDEIIYELNEQNNNIDVPLIIYYGTSRAVLRSPLRKRNFQKNFSRFEALNGALNADADFHRLFQWFDAMEDKERRLIKEKRDFDFVLPELTAVRNAITTMLPEFSNPHIETRPLRFMIDKNMNGQTLSYRIDQLSDGYKTVLAMVMDIAARMSEANPHLSNPLESEAIIMIDEVDLHLHPRWQQNILIDLQRTFPNVQFIVTTHSPQVLTTVEAKNIQAIVLENGEPKKEIFDFSYGAKSHELLKEILGVDERPQNLEIVQKLNRYLKMVDQNEYNSSDAKALRSELNNWGYGREKELLKADMDIRLKEYQKNR